MINKIIKISFGGLILMAGLLSCSVEGPSDVMSEPADKVSPIGPDVVAGELLVRFDPSVSEILDKAGVITKSGADAASRSGILSVDEVLELVNGPPHLLISRCT